MNHVVMLDYADAELLYNAYSENTMNKQRETNEKLERKMADKKRSLHRGAQRGGKQSLGYELMRGEK